VKRLDFDVLFQTLAGPRDPTRTRHDSCNPYGDSYLRIRCAKRLIFDVLLQM